MPLSRNQVDCDQFFQLFDQLDDVTFFMKDAAGRYEVYCDGTARGVTAARGDSIVNHTDFEIYPATIASRIAEDDQRVIQTQQPLVNAVEFLISPQHLLAGWYVLNRFPIRSNGNEVIGVMGTIQPYEARRRAMLCGTEFDRVIERICATPEAPHRVEELADFLGISARQLGRKFQQALGMRNYSPNPDPFNNFMTHRAGTTGRPGWGLGGRCSWSYHTGGVQVAMCDGSVQFMSDAIAMPPWRRLHSRVDGQVVSIEQ